MSRTAHEQLIEFLKDMYSVEQQALAQMTTAPDLTGDPSLAAAFRQHQAETEQHAALLAGRLEAHTEKPDVIKGLIMKLGGKGFLAFAAVQPETPGRLVAHAYSYEAMEWAGYEMLIRFAEAAGDAETAEVARTIGAQERTMMGRLESGFDAAEQASHLDTPAAGMAGDLRKHLGEAHALENQGIHLLSKGEDIADDPELAASCSANLIDCRKHAQLIEERLSALGTESSTLKDTALALMGLNWSYFFHFQTDTPAKLAAFAYAFEHLKIAGYELLSRSARRGDDGETLRLCRTLLTDEQTMVERLAEVFDSAVDATLAAVSK